MKVVIVCSCQNETEIGQNDTRNTLKARKESWVTLNVIILNNDIFPPDADIT